jgi:ribosomal protein L3 glutamine methyltransferase
VIALAAGGDARPGSDILGDVVAWAAARFEAHGLVFGHGTDNAEDEALVLALHAIGEGFDAPAAILESRLSGAQIERMVGLVERRIAERIPAPYLTGEAWFAGLRFAVDRRALIPRSPIAEWIGRRFEPWLDPASVAAVLDIGTGCGCIAVACALAFPNATVEATDISRDALALAASNVRAHGLGERIRLIESDLWSGVAGAYDLIVSNPPYLDRAEIARLPAEFRYEPTLGLAAGEDGLAVIERIIAGAPAHLRPGGVLVIEVGASRDALSRACDLPFVWLDLERGGENVLLIDAADLAGRRSRAGT